MKRFIFFFFFIVLQAQSVQAQFTADFDEILIPMRDGSFLSADVYIPNGTIEGEVILIQTPYNKNMFSVALPMGVGQNLDEQAFIWVIVDWRGFYGSNGADLSNVNRGEDGYDVCQWISEQSWHKDRIGTWGPSALGGIQYQTAKEQHPNHTCAVPMVAHPQFSYDSYFTGGVLEEARLEQLDALGYGLSPIIMSNVYYNNTWAFAENSTWYPSDIIIPTLQIGGWYDHNIDKMVDWYESTRLQAGSNVQDEQWLLVGPWVHGGTGVAYVGSSVQGELSYPNAALKSDTMAWEFFEYYLLDSLNNWQNTDFITFYELGNNTWNTSNSTTIEEINTDIIYLNTNSSLISGLGTGSSTFVSDPNNPSPSIGGATLHPDLEQGPYDQISLEGRTDILTFASVDLPQDVQISGRVTLNLFVELDQTDCDISVRLVDVYPDGRNMLITDGIRRMRFRNGYTTAAETFMVNGVIDDVEIDLPFTNYTWKSGHQIKVYVGGNSSIRWNVNLQNGGPMYTVGPINNASITIHHSTLFPSSISLPGNNSFLNINENNETLFELFPNPCSDKLTIQSIAEFDHFEIIDLSGRVLITGNSLEKTVDVSKLIDGAYIFTTIQNGKRTEKKLQIIH